MSEVEIDTTPRRARAGLSTAFFLDGLIFATWVTRIPVIQENLKLRNATLGFELLMISIGALVAMPITGKLSARFGSRAATAIAIGFFGLGLCLPGWATGLYLLGLTLTVFGAGFGAINVAANAQAVSVERQYGRPIMASFHATFSLGGIAGAVLGSVAAGHHVRPTVHFCAVGVFVMAIACLLRRWLLHDRLPTVATTPSARNLKPFIGIGLIASCSAMGEGSMSDWSSVFLRQVSHSSASVAALGFAAFSLAMTAGRLTADRLTVLIGPANVVRLGGTTAATGLAISMLFPSAVTALVGFAFVGAGLSALIPTAFSAAGRTPGVPPAVAIAAVSTMGYFGFLAGPPMIGLASDRVSLRWALVLVFTACMAVVYLAKHVRADSDTANAPSDDATPALAPAPELLL